jgi:uncharacterized protein
MIIEERIKSFLKEGSFAVAGASTNREKYGNKILRCYLQHGMTAIPINPRADLIEGVKTVSTISDLDQKVKAMSVITPPFISEKLVDEAIEKGIKHIWFQPGAESQLAIDKAETAGINVIGDGSCLLVVLGYRENAL